MLADDRPQTEIQVYTKHKRENDSGVGDSDGDDRPQTTEIQKTDIQMYKNTD